MYSFFPLRGDSYNFQLFLERGNLEGRVGGIQPFIADERLFKNKLLVVLFLLLWEVDIRSTIIISFYPRPITFFPLFPFEERIFLSLKNRRKIPAIAGRSYVSILSAIASVES